MNMKELQSLSKEELKEKLNILNKTRMDLEFKRKAGAEKPHLFKQTRRDIARINTVLNSK